MKKVALTLASIAAIATFAPEASAIPAFARQTGMACSACHFQHFPLLNGFGRAFKSGAYTMMGAQGKVEGENLDIPDRVNMAIYSTAFVQQQSGTDSRSTISTPTTGGEFSLFMGGRGSENVGFIAEAGLGGGGASQVDVAAPNANSAAGSVGQFTANAGGVVGATKMAMLYPVGDSRMGVVLHSSQGQGVAYSFETLNTGAANTHKLMGNSGPNGQHVKAYSAAQYLATNTAATGASFVANNSMGFVNLGIWEKAGNDVVTSAVALPLNYERAVYISDIAGFEMGFGVQHWGGQSAVLRDLGAAGKADASVVDFQMQGELAGMETGIYFSYGTAAGSMAGANNLDTNMFNGNPNAKTSANVAISMEVVKGATIQAAYRNGNNGAATAASDNAAMIGGTYDLAQNIALGLNYTTQSGDAWSANQNGKNVTTLLLEALF